MALWLNRRAVLKGIGAGLSLPVLECMLDSKGRLLRDGHAANVAMPIRYLAYMIQNGCPKNIWTPTDNANGTWNLNAGLQNLAPFKDDMNQITGVQMVDLYKNNIFLHTDGQKAFWTGRKMTAQAAGQDVVWGVGHGPSVEWLLGQKLGASMHFPSITASLPRNYADRFVTNGKNSFQANDTPNTYYDSPTMLAKDLFGQVQTSTTTTQSTDTRQVTVLDFLQAESARLSAKLGTADRARLDQHLTAVRDIESRLAAAKALCAPFAGSTNDPPRDTMSDALTMDIMAKLIVFAFQCDLTRYVLFEVANVSPPVASAPNYDMWDHYVSHNKDGTSTENDPDHLWIINRKMEWWAKFLQPMKASVEGDKSILYNSLSVLGSDISIGVQHNYEDMPIVTVGQAGGALITGQHLAYPTQPSWCDLHATLLTAVGLPTTKFGDFGTGTQLKGLLK